MALQSLAPKAVLRNTFPSSWRKCPLWSKHLMSWTHSGQGCEIWSEASSSILLLHPGFPSTQVPLWNSEVREEQSNVGPERRRQQRFQRFLSILWFSHSHQFHFGSMYSSKTCILTNKILKAFNIFCPYNVSFLIDSLLKFL